MEGQCLFKDSKEDCRRLTESELIRGVRTEDRAFSPILCPADETPSFRRMCRERNGCAFRYAVRVEISNSFTGSFRSHIIKGAAGFDFVPGPVVGEHAELAVPPRIEIKVFRHFGIKAESFPVSFVLIPAAEVEAAFLRGRGGFVRLAPRRKGLRGGFRRAAVCMERDSDRRILLPQNFECGSFGEIETGDPLAKSSGMGAVFVGDLEPCIPAAVRWDCHILTRFRINKIVADIHHKHGTYVTHGVRDFDQIARPCGSLRPAVHIVVDSYGPFRVYDDDDRILRHREGDREAGAVFRGSHHEIIDR